MVSVGSEQNDLNLAADFLAAKGLSAQRFTAAEMKAGKTPDFRVFQKEQLAAYCEVKSPRDDRLDNALALADPGSLVGYGGNDSTFNRIANQVHKAVQQFDAVNPNRELPNILVFINWAYPSSFRDLEETLTGYLRLESDRCEPTMLKVSEGRIRDEKYRIDAYCWIDGRTQRLQSTLFNPANDAHCNTVCSLLQIDRATIKT